MLLFAKISWHLAHIISKKGGLGGLIFILPYDLYMINHQLKGICTASLLQTTIDDRAVILVTNIVGINSAPVDRWFNRLTF